MRSLSALCFFCLTAATLASGAFSLLGCAPQAPPAKAKPVALAPPSVGEIAVVDEAERFVLIDLDSNLYEPEPGLLLRVLGPSGKTAHVRTSPERKRPFVAADIVDGHPAVGDEVVR